jgi:hypothetical protein
MKAWRRFEDWANVLATYRSHEKGRETRTPNTDGS